jgi:hypothetical protein
LLFSVLCLLFAVRFAFAVVFESRRSLSLGTGLVVSLSNPCRFAPFALAPAFAVALEFEFEIAIAIALVLAFALALDFEFTITHAHPRPLKGSPPA